MTKGFAHYRYRTFFMLIIVALCAPAIAKASVIQGNKPFLTSSINNNHPFVGEEVLLTYRLYFRDVAPKISYEKAPLFQGLWAKETGSDRFIKSMPSTVHGEHFRSAVVKQFRLVPIQSGRITISGYSTLCTVPQEQVAINSNELPESSLRITAPAITISARSLPEPIPEKLSGAVGSFSLTLMADKQNINIGEQLSLKLILTGTGSLLTLELPNLQLPENFRCNPPEKTTTLTKESEPTSGSVTATVLAWPQSEGDFQIPAVALVVFNPETKQFSTLHSKPLTITVAPAAHKAKGGEAEPLDTSLEKKVTSLHLIITTIAITLLLLISIATIVRVRNKRVTETIKTVPEGSTEPPPESGKSAKNMKQQLFALLEEAGIKSPGSMTRIELKDALQEIKIPDETRSELPAVLDSLDGILYSPAGTKENRIPEWIGAKVDALLRALKKAGTSR